MHERAEQQVHDRLVDREVERAEVDRDPRVELELVLGMELALGERRRGQRERQQRERSDEAPHSRAPEVGDHREHELERVRERVEQRGARRRPRCSTATASSTTITAIPRNIIPKPITPEAALPGRAPRSRRTARAARRRPRAPLRAPSRAIGQPAIRKTGSASAITAPAGRRKRGGPGTGRGVETTRSITSQGPAVAAVDGVGPDGDPDEGAGERAEPGGAGGRADGAPTPVQAAVAASSKPPAPAGWKDCRGGGSIRREHTRACAELVTGQTRLFGEKRQPLYAPARGVSRTPRRIRTAGRARPRERPEQRHLGAPAPLADEFELVLPTGPATRPTRRSTRSTSTTRRASWPSCSATARTSPGSRTAA